jgi:hypothetical protein
LEVCRFDPWEMRDFFHDEGIALTLAVKKRRALTVE